MEFMKRALVFTVLGFLAALPACQGGQAETLAPAAATTASTMPRDFSEFSLFLGPMGSATTHDYDSPTLEDVVTGGLYGAGATS